MTRVTSFLKRNAIALSALFIALGGTSYAVVDLPAGSVGARQIRNRSITPVKLDPKVIGGVVRAWAYVSPNGRLLAGRGFTRVRFSPPGIYGLALKDQRDVTGCAATASVVYQEFASGSIEPGSAPAVFAVNPGPAGAGVETFNSAGQQTPLPFVVQVLC